MARGESVTVLLLRKSILIYFISYDIVFFPGQNKKEEKNLLDSSLTRG